MILRSCPLLDPYAMHYQRQYAGIDLLTAGSKIGLIQTACMYVSGSVVLYH